MWVRLDDENKEILLEWYRSTDHHSFEAMAQALLGEAKGEPKVAPNEAYAKLRDLRDSGLPVLELITKIETLVAVSFPKGIFDEQRQLEECALALRNSVSQDPYTDIVLDMFLELKGYIPDWLELVERITVAAEKEKSRAEHRRLTKTNTLPKKKVTFSKPEPDVHQLLETQQKQFWALQQQFNRQNEQLAYQQNLITQLSQWVVSGNQQSPSTPQTYQHVVTTPRSAPYKVSS